MLDVHPAPHAASTWREFFIHIATIVLGLLIAVGLEQTVELVHRHREAREARENIRQEIQVNVGINQSDLEQMDRIQQKLDRDYDLLNSSAPDAQILAQLDYHFQIVHWQSAAWNAARINGSLALIPSEDIKGASYFYATADAIDPTAITFFVQMRTAQALLERCKASGKLSELNRQDLESLTSSATGSASFISNVYARQIDSLKATSLQ